MDWKQKEMKEKIDRLLTSYGMMLVLLVLYAIGLAVATFIEKQHGTMVAKALVYYSPLFFFLQFLLVLNFVGIAWKYNYWSKRRWGLCLTHCSMILILLGAFTTHLLSEEGYMHLREGECSDQIMLADPYHSDQTNSLPFSIELKKFTLTRYPGSASPSSYESLVIVHEGNVSYEARIFMNNVLDVQGYRFFQASYDPDELGTILSVNHDVAGRTITYCGYAGLLIGLLGALFGKHSRFARMSRKLSAMHKGNLLALLLLLFMTQSLQAKETTHPMLQAVQQYPVSVAHAAHFGSLPVQSTSGRMMPVNTFSSEILRKLHKSDRIGSLNSDQFLLSLLAMPEMWMRVPFITYKNKELTQAFGLTEGSCAYIEVFDEQGRYKLQEQLEQAYSKPLVARTAFDKDLMKLDEQLNIFNQLVHQQLLALFPLEHDPLDKWYASGDDLSSFTGKDSMFVSRIMDWYLAEVQDALQGNDWSKADEIVGMISTYQQAKNHTLDISPEKMQSEIRYNKLNIFRSCKIGYLICGGLLLLCTFFAMFRKARLLTIVTYGFFFAIIAFFCYQTYGLGMRWYIGGYAPWSNSYETMVYVSWATVLAGLLFARRSLTPCALATLFGGIILFVSGLNWMDPQINPLVPVLKSPWLMFHVAVIVAAYGFLGIGFLLGLTNLLLMSFGCKYRVVVKRIEEMTILCELLLWIGLALLTIGTFLGAIWANESWGRYWGWDPKETWALITMVVYAFVTHMHLIKQLDNPWCFNVSSVLAFSSVLMTYFGVNYFLSGMHSYGENDQVYAIFGYLYGILAVVLLLSASAYIGWKKRNRNKEL